MMLLKGKFITLIIMNYLIGHIIENERLALGKQFYRWAFGIIASENGLKGRQEGKSVNLM